MGTQLSRTDKTKPFWVKLAHGDLAVVEKHDHTDGHQCDLPDPFDAFAFHRLTTHCRREFFDTGTRVCCCPMCHGAEWPDRDEPQRRRHERRQAKLGRRSWVDEY
jgi:hypothetical protein